MKKNSYIFFFLFNFLLISVTEAQQVPLSEQVQQPQQVQTLKIAFFTPLYLDSAFDAGYTYKFGKNFPKFLNPGLEFYQGAQMALDSLNKAGAPLEVFIYDSRSKTNPFDRQITRPEVISADMIIAHASAVDVRPLADLAKQNNIPFISATFPNDAGIVNNPYYVMLNPTLKTHVESLYRYLQKNHAKDRVIVFRKNGPQEDQIRSYLRELSANGNNSLKLEFRDIGNDITNYSLSQGMDTLRRTVAIAGSLDENFGNKLVQQLSALGKSYPITVIGMPTWDNLNLSKPEIKNIEVVYSTPFNFNAPSALNTKLTNDFVNNVNSRPTDMFFRGYETMLRFALLLLDTKKDVASNLTRKGNYIFTQYEIQPVFINKESPTLDYFENKKLYYVRVVNGVKSLN
jgi:ABC-type branched-subunit amino acid transport system substrate-binding protein